MSDDLLIPEDMPVIDKARLEGEFGGDEEILIELRDLFMDHAPTMFEEIKKAISDKDVDALYNNSHDFMGACATYGAPRLVMVCRVLKGASGSNCWEYIDDIKKKLVEEYDKVMDAVGKWGSPE